jgi:peptidoglycan/xylan/chitin deacetylase (PgdA/CDA1 family)
MGIKRRLASLYFPELLVKRHINKNLDDSMGYILMYHEVLPESASVPAWTVVKENQFRWQIEFLQKHYDVISMDEAKSRISGQSKGYRPFVVITFDDGYSGNLSTVLPLMRSLNAPFAIYVATKAIQDGELYWYDRIINLLQSGEDIVWKPTTGDTTEIFRIPAKGSDDQRWVAVQEVLTWLKTLNEDDRQQEVARIVDAYTGLKPNLRMLTPEELGQLAADPLVTIGCHTHAHELLDQLDDEAVLSSVNTANLLLEKWTGELPVHFSYPNGNVDERVRKVIEKAGFRTAVTTENRPCSIKNNVFALPRPGVGRFDSKGHFKAKMAGFL